MADEVKVETICGAPMPDRLWLVDMGSGDVSWTAEREPDGEAPLEAVEYVRLAARPALAGDAPEALKLADEYAAKGDWNGAYHALRVAMTTVPAEDAVERVRRAWSEMMREFGRAFGDIDNGYYAEVEEMRASVAALAAMQSRGEQQAGREEAR